MFEKLKRWFRRKTPIKWSFPLASCIKAEVVIDVHSECSVDPESSDLLRS